MRDRMERLRKNYEGFKKGEKGVLDVRDQARSVLEEARRRGDREVVDEVADILIDLEFSIEENRCKCHRKSPSC